MSEYLLSNVPTSVPQSEPLDERQVANSAGGFSYAADIWTRLRRFLILGSEGGSYYASERNLTKENTDALRACVATDGPRAVEEIATVSEQGRAARNDPALFALAYAISHGDKETRIAAGKALPRVARIPTHLYHFNTYAEAMRGRGRVLNKAVTEWFNGKDVKGLAYHAVKYRSRDGWAMRDLLRLVKPTTEEVERSILYGWIAGNVTDFSATGKDHPLAIIEGYEHAQRAKTPKATAALVRDYGLPREALLTDHLTDVGVWTAMLEAGMPIGAMVRNLGNMTRLGVLDSRDNLNMVTGTLGNTDAVRKSRLHPMAILIGLRTYAQGRGMRGTGTWQPKPDVIDALDAAFYLAFGNVEKTGKRFLLGVDVSGSMSSGQVAGSPLTPREAAVAMALVTLNAETNVEVMAFSGGFVTLPISRSMRLDQAVAMTRNMPFDSTDCALPMLWASQRRLAIDSFVVYTDSETWYGTVHPMEALRSYREHYIGHARLAVVGMVGNRFTIADPNDKGTLDVVGFDTATPAILSEFAAGRV